MLNGKDTAGNEVTVQKKVVSLDLDKPALPIVNSNSSYATLTVYGATFNKATTITYDSRTDIDNYYSIDNGTTWIPYTGQFDMASGTLIAKSIKKSTGLEVSVSKTITMPADAIKPEAYDGDSNTYMNLPTGTNCKIKVDESMRGKKINIKTLLVNGHVYALSVKFVNSSGTVISTSNITSNSIITTTFSIPLETTEIWLYRYSYSSSIYEIEILNEPIFTATNGYMLLHADSNKAIRNPYQMISISYLPTSVQRLYRIGMTGNWLNYDEQLIKVNQGETIYAKGIDQYGNETRITSSYTANVADAVGVQAYDGDANTYMNLPTGTNFKIKVDESMKGKEINIKTLLVNAHVFALTVKFVNSSGTVISTSNITSNSTITTTLLIPIETTEIWLYRYSYSSSIYEITPIS